MTISYNPGDRVATKCGVGTVIRINRGAAITIVLLDGASSVDGRSFAVPCTADKQAAKAIGIDLTDGNLHYVHVSGATPIIDHKTPPGTKCLAKYGSSEFECVMIRQRGEGCETLCAVNAANIEATGNQAMPGLSYPSNVDAAHKFGFDIAKDGFFFFMNHGLTFLASPTVSAKSKPTPPEKESIATPSYEKPSVSQKDYLTPTLIGIAAGLGGLLSALCKEEPPSPIRLNAQIEPDVDSNENESENEDVS